MHAIAPYLYTNAWALRECVTAGLDGDLVEKGNAEDLVAVVVAVVFLFVIP
jgi:hypothetical protein